MGKYWKWNFNLVAACLVALLFAACGQQKADSKAQEPPTNQEAQWLTDFETAQAQARSQNKKLLMNFTGSDWCPPCVMLHHQVFSQPEFVNYAAEHLVLLEVDFPHNKAQTDEQKAANDKLAERFGVYWFPTEIVLDAKGDKLGQLNYMPGGPKPFIAALEQLPKSSGMESGPR
jgi:thioredoxin-related protein